MDYRKYCQCYLLDDFNNSNVNGENSIGSLGANLSQVALQFALLFNSVYANKVWASGAANNEGGAK